jgi:hypothetical protein
MRLAPFGEELVSVNPSDHNPAVLFTFLTLFLFQFYQIHGILPIVLGGSCYLRL